MSERPDTRSDRTTARDDLLAQGRLASAILETTASVVVVLGAGGRIVLLNRAAESICGYTFDDLPDLPIWAFLIPEEQREGVRMTFESLTAGDFPNEYENEWMTPDGERRRIAWSNTALTDDGGNVRYIVGTGIDVTERERAESQLRDAIEHARRRETELAALAEAARAVIAFHAFEQAARAIFDTCREVIGARSGYIAMLSEDASENDVLFLESGGLPCTVDPALPMPIRGLRARAYERAETVVDNDFMSSHHVQYIPRGHVELRNVMFAPLVLGNTVHGVMGLANKPGGFDRDDVRLATAFAEVAAAALQSSRTIEMLEDSEQRFRSVADTATDAIVCTDAAGVVTYWNRAAAEIFGHPAEALIGRSIRTIMPERLGVDHVERIAMAAEGEDFGRIGATSEALGRRADGTEFPIEISIARWHKASEVFFTAIIRDITARRIAEDSLVRVYEKEHRIAEALQESLLHPVPPIGGLKIGLVYHPSDIAERVGGDFYDAFVLDDGRVAVLIGDVAGKGVKAAGLTETIRSAVRTLAYLMPSPAQVFERVNHVLLRQLPDDQFATAALVVLDTLTGEGRFASAGHVPPVLRGAGCRLIEPPAGLPLGVQEGTYGETRIRLDPGDLLVLYTDGLTDARRDGEFFTEKGVMRALCATAAKDPQEAADALMKACDAFAGDQLSDDVAIVAITRA